MGPSFVSIRRRGDWGGWNTTRGHFVWKHPLCFCCMNVLLLEERGYPQDEGSADDGCAELSEKTTPLDAELLEEPAAEQTSEKTEDEIHDEAKASTLHQLACNETGKASDN